MNRTYRSYDIVWPETAVFWGAGATQTLGIKTTRQLSEAISKLADDKEPSIQKRIEEALGSQVADKYGRSIENLLYFIGENDDVYHSEKETRLKEEFSDQSLEQAEQCVRELREVYRWDVLKAVIKICPQINGLVSLQDLFTLLDMHINGGVGFRVGVSSEKGLGQLTKEQLSMAQHTVKLLIVTMHSIAYEQMLESSPDLLNAYQGFAACLYQLMKEEGLRRASEDKDLARREFYLSSFSIISMNWDPILLWQSFCANEQFNNRKDRPYIGSPALPLKMYHDLGHFMGVRQVDGEDPGVWYPFNETVVQRINDPDHVTGRRVRVGKFYFPHGSVSWRECPNCAKLVAYLGHEWKHDTHSLFPPLPLPKLSFGFDAKSKEEHEAHASGRADAIQCPFCGSMTRTWHTPLVMQSTFKGNHPPYVEEIQRDMRVSLEGAKHIVLMGYGLPPDDFIYRSILASRRNHGGVVKCSIVSYFAGADAKWLEGTEVNQLIQDVEAKDRKNPILTTIESARALFGDDNVRVYAAGVPRVFLDSTSGKVDLEKVRQLLYPISLND